jgi:chromatin remodeling complex protein RSC6
MVRASKSATPASVSAPVAAPIVAPAQEASAAPAKKAAKKLAKSAAPVEEASAPAAAPLIASEDAAPLTNEVVAIEDVSSVSQKMMEFGAKLQQLNSIFSTIKGDFKTLEKAITREMKVAQKSSSKKVKRAGNRQPSGFVKPTRISDELAAFLGKSVGSEMARTVVSKEINNYIRTNSLQDKTNGRKIIPDAKLAALLKTQASDELTYFNLQRFMKHHFIKAEVVATA